MNIGDNQVDVVAHEQLVNLAIMRANQALIESQAEQLKAGAELLRARAGYWKRLTTCIGWATVCLVAAVVVVFTVVT